ncbi:hypothetical protein [Microbispora sp. NPDC049125]|uniref:hypothetical protein n=1 Tax=Microbispora sp. NPDC049125 TaxID=3154929 RepID=UPI003464FDF0
MLGRLGDTEASARIAQLRIAQSGIAQSRVNQPRTVQPRIVTRLGMAELLKGPDERDRVRRVRRIRRVRRLPTGRGLSHINRLGRTRRAHRPPGVALLGWGRPLKPDDGALNDGALNDGALNDGALNDGALNVEALNVEALTGTAGPFRP